MMRDPGQRPDSSRSVFETFTRVRFHEVDTLGHVNNAAYLNYLEQAAIDHATLVGLDLPTLHRLGGVFVARRHEIEFLRPVFAGDLLRIVTWLNDPRGARVERNYLVSLATAPPSGLAVNGRLIDGAIARFDEPLVVRATTEWVFTNNEGKPRRIPGDVTTLFQARLPRGTPHGQRRGNTAPSSCNDPRGMLAARCSCAPLGSRRSASAAQSGGRARPASRRRGG
jgi:YbgC/YbaW family acyl-CoA thioester hydrolase